jgi:Holliday junction resolvasome RuvABC endonuclease subunit
MAKIKKENIVEELEKEGWKLLSEKYENLETIMTFKCPEGHQVFSSWKKMRNKKECPICKRNIYKDQDEKIVPKKKGTKRTLALDQATKISGYSIYDSGELIKYGTFKTSLDSEIARDNVIKNWLINMIENWKPDLVALEGIQFQQTKIENGQVMNVGVTTFETLARLQGILWEAVYELGIPCEICHTGTWRKHCGVKGRSSTDKKRSMQLLAKEWFDITITNDEADAIGIGKYATDVFGRVPKIENWE